MPILVCVLCFLSMPLFAQEKVNLHLNRISLEKVIHLLAKEGNLSVIIEPELDKKLTLDIEDVTPKEALRAVALASHLDLKEQGDVFIIGDATKADKLVMQTDNGEAIPSLFTKVVSIRYADANELEDVLNNESAQLISKFGSLLADERSNSLIIKDTEENITQISALIRQLDHPVQQVLIEARIVIMEEGQLDEFGVRWGMMKSSGSVQAAGHLDGISSEEANLNDLLNVDLGVADARAASGALQIASIGEGVLLDLELNALQAESKAEIISSPRLLTTNNKTAIIEQGTEIPYQEKSGEDSSTLTFRKAVLSLEVTPQITPEKDLLLDLSVSQDRVGNSVKVGLGEALTINTQHIGTQVLIGDGQTLVLGGIYQQQNLSGEDKVPGLSELPLIGSLFKHTYQQTDKKELIIFVTPSVLSPRKSSAIDRL